MLLKWVSVFGAAALIMAVPRPAAVEPAGWQLLAVFGATMVGLVLRPLPAGAMVFLGICALAVSGLVPIREALAGYGEPVVWLVLSAFFISRAMIKTGLGRRIALRFVQLLGRTSIGVAYALTFTDLLLGMIIPSNGARSGGVIFPIGKSIAETYDSRPGPTARRLGSYLMLQLYQCDVIICAMFLTGQASNALIASFAGSVAGLDLSYTRWMISGALPGLISLALVPLLLYRLHPPEVKQTPAAREIATADLERMGALSRDEKIMQAVFALVLGLWMTKAWHPIDYVAVAMLGVGVLLLTNVLSWDDITAERSAWDVFFWYGGLVQLAKLLSEGGVIKWFAGDAAAAVNGWVWWAALAALVIVYFYTHYGFASITAHVTAMYVPFLSVCLALGAPPLLTALILAHVSNLSAALTHYGTTPAPIYFGANYVSQREWWRVGLLVSFVTLLIWGTIGPLWWKLLGWW
ncbi:MAG: DASS family sodium-coupled anion symporter [Gemmatimonadota bacterium]